MRYPSTTTMSVVSAASLRSYTNAYSVLHITCHYGRQLSQGACSTCSFLGLKLEIFCTGKAWMQTTQYISRQWIPARPHQYQTTKYLPYSLPSNPQGIMSRELFPCPNRQEDGQRPEFWCTFYNVLDSSTFHSNKLLSIPKCQQCQS